MYYMFDNLTIHFIPAIFFEINLNVQFLKHVAHYSLRV